MPLFITATIRNPAEQKKTHSHSLKMDSSSAVGPSDWLPAVGLLVPGRITPLIVLCSLTRVGTLLLLLLRQVSFPPPLPSRHRFLNRLIGSGKSTPRSDACTPFQPDLVTLTINVAFSTISTPRALIVAATPPSLTRPAPCMRARRHSICSAQKLGGSGSIYLRGRRSCGSSDVRPTAGLGISNFSI